MPTFKLQFSRTLCAVTISLLALALVSFPIGCSEAGSAPPPSVAGQSLTGRVFGGQQPVSHASIQLYAPGTTGYGSAATPLLNTPVTSDTLGRFSITGDYTCPSAATSVYLVVTGGNPGLPGLADNRAIVMMDLLGACGNLSPSSFVVVNELTTVAAAWALAPFAIDYAHIGTSPTNVQGLWNAVVTATNLVSPASGSSPGNAPAIATVPTPVINTLGDVLAACVNTNGSLAANSACGMLFSAATPAGSPTPADTFAAALDIARNPGLNPAAIFSTVTASSPFQPTLSAAPQDWTLAINWVSPTFQVPSDLAIDSQGSVWIVSTPGGSSSSVISVLNSAGITSSFPQSNVVLSHLALDATDNPWLIDTADSTVLKFNSSGAPDPGNPFIGGGISSPGILAFDGYGNLWIGNSGPTLSEFSSRGVAVSPSSGFSTTGTGAALALALDTGGNIWLADRSSNNISVLSNHGKAILGSPYSGGGLDSPFALAIDTTGGAWVANRTGSSLTRLSSAGDPVGGPYTGGGLSAPIGITLDGVDNVWLINSGTNSISEFLSSGHPQSGVPGYGSGYLINPFHAAIDRSGSVWVANLGTATPGSGTITQIVGAAAPIITPLALAVQNNVLDQRP